MRRLQRWNHGAAGGGRHSPTIYRLQRPAQCLPEVLVQPDVLAKTLSMLPAYRRYILAKECLAFSAVRRLLEVGVRDLAAFLQEPRGHLPFNRGAELELYLRGLIETTVLNGASSDEIRSVIRMRIAETPFNETIHKLFYEIGELTAKGSGKLSQE